MGYELTNFIGEVDVEYLCSICKQVLDNPLQLQCEHIYCYTCINNWVSVSACCPDDRSTVILEEIQPPGRYYLNLLGKLMIKCDFHLQGCQTITKLEHLKVHLTSCEYNPNAEITCSKGCNMKMCRHEYDAHDCIALLVHRTNSNEEMNAELRNEATKLNEELEHQHNKITRLTEEMTRIRDQLEYFKNATPGQVIVDLNLFSDSPRKWKVCNNMKTSTLQPNILETDNHYHHAHAQSLFPLAPSKHSFQIQILNVENSFGWILIGLTRNGHPLDKMPGFNEESIGYSSHGELLVEAGNNVVGSQWRNGDIIEVGIRYPRNGNRDYAQIYFNRNELLITERRILRENYEAFPTIRMFGKGTKVKCLNN